MRYYVCTSCFKLAKRKSYVFKCDFCGEKVFPVDTKGGRDAFENNKGVAFDGSQEVNYDEASKRSESIRKLKRPSIFDESNLLLYNIFFGGADLFLLYKGGRMYLEAKYVAEQLASYPFLFVGFVWLSLLAGINLIYFEVRKNR